MKPAITKDYKFSQQHLIGIDHLSADDIRLVLDRADDYAAQLEKGIVISDALKGKIIITLFFEHSTRTRTSFEMAARRLGAQVINWDAGSSSLSKGESFTDTILTLNAMGPDAIIVRHNDYGAPEFIANHVRCPVINAGDSHRAHPTQALLDALTIRQEKGRIEGLNIAICGDIAHSRVAASNIELLTKTGAHVRLIAPPALMPEKKPENAETFTDMQEGLKDCDIVMTLRIQKERMQDGLVGSEESYFADYGLTLDKLAHAKKDVRVMHPGPMNRGVEISDEVADDPDRSLILKQVANGVPVRMAVLELLLAGV